MKQLKKFLKGRHTLIFIDFEGTQFTHEIIASGLYKCKIDGNGKIINNVDNGLLIYTKPRSSIGKIVTQMTHLTDEFIQENGISWEETINKINDYIGDDLEDTIFVCFGNNDPKMILESCRYSHPDNQNIAKEWLNNIFDFMAFISQYIRDEKNNTYSLVNFLKLYSIEANGESHNPLNDAIDLKNLYQAFVNNKSILYEEYKHYLSRQKTIPIPIKSLIEEILKGNTVNLESLENSIKNYFE